MRDLKRRLARPTRLHLSALVVMIVLIITVGVIDVMSIPANAGSTHVPWFSVGIMMVLLPLVGAGTFVRSMFWMNEEYPSQMYDIGVARRTAVRRTNSRLEKYQVFLAHWPLPWASVAFIWFFNAVLAVGVVLFATGILP